MSDPSSALEEMVVRQCNTLLATAAVEFNQPISTPAIRFDLRGQAAGQMRYTKSRNLEVKNVCLRFNKSLLLRYQTEFINQTVPHEVAHFVAYSVYGCGIKPHGKEWRHIMQAVFNTKPQVRHHFEVERKSRKTVAYTCSCNAVQHDLSLIRHRRVKEGSARYLCKRCQSELVPLVETQAQ